VLNGDAGDELFIGYDWYNKLRLTERLDRLPKSFHKAFSWLASLLSIAPANSAIARKIRTLDRLMQGTPEARYMELTGSFTHSLRHDLLAKSFLSELSHEPLTELVDDIYHRTHGLDLVSRTMYANIGSYLPNDLLVKTDIASMTYGLECRSPLLDHEFVEIAARIPIEYKLQGGATKRIFKDAFSDLLPESIRSRRKMGFSTPLAEWLRGPYCNQLSDMLLSSTCRQRGYFDSEIVLSLINEHHQGVDHSRQLWTLLVLEQWHLYFDSLASRTQGTCPDLLLINEN
jgi:asparagine synthase (glutamine-hydrolysing)